MSIYIKLKKERKHLKSKYKGILFPQTLIATQDRITHFYPHFFFNDCMYENKKKINGENSMRNVFY